MEWDREFWQATGKKIVRVDGCLQAVKPNEPVAQTWDNVFGTWDQLQAPGLRQSMMEQLMNGNAYQRRMLEQSQALGMQNNINPYYRPLDQQQSAINSFFNLMAQNAYPRQVHDAGADGSQAPDTLPPEREEQASPGGSVGSHPPQAGDGDSYPDPDSGYPGTLELPYPWGRREAE